MGRRLTRIVERDDASGDESAVVMIVTGTAVAKNEGVCKLAISSPQQS
jgi:hypothetical protein